MAPPHLSTPDPHLFHLPSLDLICKNVVGAMDVSMWVEKTVYPLPWYLNPVNHIYAFTAW